MGLVILKKKIVADIKPMVSDFAAQIDEVGRLTEEAAPILAQIKALQGQLKPLNEAKAALQAHVDAIEGDDDDKLVEIGQVYRLEIGKKGSAREIKDLPGVKKMMGTELFMKVAKVTLKDLDQYLTGPQRDTVIKTSRTARSYEVERRLATGA